VKVTMNIGIVGGWHDEDGYHEYPPRGVPADLPAAMAADLVAQGYAETPSLPPKAEKATATPGGEKRTSPAVPPRRGPGRPRKDGN